MNEGNKTNPQIASTRLMCCHWVQGNDVSFNFSICVSAYTAVSYEKCIVFSEMTSLIAKFMGPTWGPTGTDRTQVGPMLAPWILLSGLSFIANFKVNVSIYIVHIQSSIKTRSLSSSETNGAFHLSDSSLLQVDARLITCGARVISNHISVSKWPSYANIYRVPISWLRTYSLW